MDYRLKSSHSLSRSCEADCMRRWSCPEWERYKLQLFSLLWMYDRIPTTGRLALRILELPDGIEPPQATSGFKLSALRGWKHEHRPQGRMASTLLSPKFAACSFEDPPH